MCSTIANAGTLWRKEISLRHDDGDDERSGSYGQFDFQTWLDEFAERSGT